MATRHSIEVFCPTCQTWQDSGVGAPAEVADDGGVPVITGTDKLVPPCGHGVPANDYRTRLGPEMDVPLPEDEGSHELHDDDGPNPDLDPSV